MNDTNEIEFKKSWIPFLDEGMMMMSVFSSLFTDIKKDRQASTQMIWCDDVKQIWVPAQQILPLNYPVFDEWMWVCDFFVLFNIKKGRTGIL